MIFLGIDYDTYKATLVALDVRPPVIASETIRYRRAVASGETFMMEALGEVVEALRESPLLPVADAIALERGWGASRRSDWQMGAFYGALLAAIKLRYPAKPVEYVKAAEWKREVTGKAGMRDGKGNGNVKKETAHACLAEIAPLIHPELTPIEVLALDSDERDALAIAWTYRRMSERTAERYAGDHVLHQ